MARRAGGLRLLGYAVAEGVGDDTGGVEVGEHFWTEGVDYFRDFAGERGARLTELVERVGGGWVEGEEERAERFKDVHACFSEAEGGECD